MRLILALLAMAQIRLSAFESARSDMLARRSNEALARAEARMTLAESFARRARQAA